MKNRNQRELEKHWAEQQKKAAKKSPPPPKKSANEKPNENPAEKL
ncbi:MAG TPA: hypothetical protein VGL89_02905 [Candidatus Koribacter sp.]|jgi:hypothetical protein